MKKIFILMAFIPVLLISCFEYDGRTSRALIKALVRFPSDVAKIHVAVYDGAILPDNILLTETATPSSGLNISVPAGENRMFLILGEDYEGLAKYYGVSGPYNVSEDSMVDVVANMKKIADNFNLTHPVGAAATPLVWNSMPGATQYTVMRMNVTGQGVPILPFVLHYFGFVNTCAAFTSTTYYSISAFYEVFNLNSVSFYTPGTI
jgi:hypothetical protein